MSQPDAKTFDLISVLSGRGYPEHKVPVLFNETLGFTVQSLREGLNLAVAAGDSEQTEILQKKLDSVLKDIKSEIYTFTLRGIPESVRRDIIDQVRAEFPPKKNVFGQPEMDIKADQVLTLKLWEAYIVKVEDADGNVDMVGEGVVEKIFNEAPRPVHEAINAGIDVLVDGSKSGFEFAVQEIDFLSQA